MNATWFPSLPGMIAWLSLCLLAAAWGHALDDRWQAIWGQAGSVGLVAAVVLGRLEKIRVAREEHVRKAALRVRSEYGLARLNEHAAALDSINAAMRRLVDHASRQRFGYLPKGNRAAREAELLAGYPLQIVGVDDPDAAGEPHAAEPLSGALRQISSAVILFEHAKPLATRLVVLTFELDDAAGLSLVVDIMWSKKSGHEFVTSGAILAAGVSPDHKVGASTKEPALVTS